MPEEEFQLMVHGVTKNTEIKVAGDSDVEILQEHFVDNERYLFLDIRVPAWFKGDGIGFEISDGDFKMKMSYPLLKRDDSPNIHSGISSRDLIYLIFPDRFANGNKENDVELSMTDKRVVRDSLKTRHGGDIQGIRDKLFHVKDLGATAIWINPLLTNDQPWESYHGYAATNHYEIDPRFGSLQNTKDMVEECHRGGIKVIKDIVFNHVEANHHLIKIYPQRIGFISGTSFREPVIEHQH